MSTLSLERDLKLRVFRDEILGCTDRAELAASMMAIVQFMRGRLQVAGNLASVDFTEQDRTLATMWNAVPNYSTLTGLQHYALQAIEQILIVEQTMVDAMCAKIGADLKV